MPDSFGERNHERAKAKKASDKEERRVARAQRKRERLDGPTGPTEAPVTEAVDSAAGDESDPLD